MGKKRSRKNRKKDSLRREGAAENKEKSRERDEEAEVGESR